MTLSVAWACSADVTIHGCLCHSGGGLHGEDLTTLPLASAVEECPVSEGRLCNSRSGVSHLSLDSPLISSSLSLVIPGS